MQQVDWVVAVAKAASLPVAAGAAPLAIVVQSLPSAGWLQWIQVLGTLAVAGIAAVISTRIQSKQAETARRSWNTADTKLKLDLFDKRYTIFESAKDLITDAYLSGVNTIEANEYTRLRLLAGRTVGARWLLDEAIEVFIQHVVKEAEDRWINKLVAKQQAAANPAMPNASYTQSAIGLDVMRQKARLDELIQLFTRYMQIRYEFPNQSWLPPQTQSPTGSASVAS